ncbi:disks large-associated protein 5 isoform X1 [Arapaima gigas]
MLGTKERSTEKIVSEENDPCYSIALWRKSRMESRFSHLYQRDSSVSMLRVRMSRRRSRVQKENRDRAVNQRRHLDKLSELESSALEVSINRQATVIQKQTKKTNSAVEERKQMLARYKEAKELQKEKERREREKNGKRVFKVGLYKPQPLASLPQVSTLLPKTKAPVPAQSSRVTRSMKQQQDQKVSLDKCLMNDPLIVLQLVFEAAVKRAPTSRVTNTPQLAPTASRGRATSGQSTVHVPTTRSASQAASAVRKPSSADMIMGGGPKTRSATKQLAEPPKSSGKSMLNGSKDANNSYRSFPPTSPDKVKAAAEPERNSREKIKEDIAEANNPPNQPSFAPKDFVFQAPAGLKCFQSVPLTPRSADAFLTPSGVPSTCSFSTVVQRLSMEPPALSPHPPTPPPDPHIPLSTMGPQEAQHDVAYFRAIMASETDRLTQLSEQWEMRTEDTSIPEEMRDRMRTAVGQARLLMKERFGQFAGLVDDCDLGRGEKITTCSDLEGFWDMVYFQVEDVTRKFDALKEAESRDWQDEPKPQPRPKKTVKKPPPSTATGKGAIAGGASAAAKSRLAAVKAAMRAKQAVSGVNVDVSTGIAGDSEEVVVFQGGFFKVESPAKLPGPLRRSSRLSAAPAPLQNPCITPKLTTPARSRCSTAARSLVLTPNQQATLTRKPAHTEEEDTASLLCPSSIQEPNHSPVMQQHGSNSQLVSSDQTKSTPEPIKAHSEASSVSTVVEAISGQSWVHSMQVLDIADQEGVLEPTGITADRDPKADTSPADDCQLSFTLSPCPAQSGPLAPTESLSLTEPLQTFGHAATASTSPLLRSVVSTDVEMISSDNMTDTEDIPGLDFERYLRPALRTSLSPRLSDTPMATDILVESPVPCLGEQPSVGTLTHMGEGFFCLWGLLFVCLFVLQATDYGLPLFTPGQKTRVQPSVCEVDLMTFTPPSNH